MYATFPKLVHLYFSNIYIYIYFSAQEFITFQLQHFHFMLAQSYDHSRRQNGHQAEPVKLVKGQKKKCFKCIANLGSQIYYTSQVFQTCFLLVPNKWPTNIKSRNGNQMLLDSFKDYFISSIKKVLSKFNSVGGHTLGTLNSMCSRCMKVFKSIGGWSLWKSNSMGGGVRKKVLSSPHPYFFSGIVNNNKMTVNAKRLEIFSGFSAFLSDTHSRNRSTSTSS